MPTFLSDPTASVYLVFALIAGGALFYWYRTQNRRGLIVLASGLGLFALLFLCDELVESPREEAVSRIEAMIVAINASQPQAVAEHISSGFRHGGISKESFESAPLWTLLRQHSVQVAAWDFDRGYVEQPNPDTILIGFMSKASGSGHFGSFDIALYIKATFVKDPDGAFRLKTFTAYSDPMRKANGPEFPIPGIPN